jgi:hypothetical protein
MIRVVLGLAKEPFNPRRTKTAAAAALAKGVSSSSVLDILPTYLVTY